MDKTLNSALSDKTGTNHVLPRNYSEMADDMENFNVHDDDIWIVTQPKSGTYSPQPIVHRKH